MENYEDYKITEKEYRINSLIKSAEYIPIIGLGLSACSLIIGVVGFAMFIAWCITSKAFETSIAMMQVSLILFISSIIVFYIIHRMLIRKLALKYNIDYEKYEECKKESAEEKAE